MYILILAIIAATVGGVAVAVQSGLVGLVNQRLGTIESVFITYFGGGMAILAIMLLWGGGSLGEWRKLPWYAFLGGPLGLIIIGTLSYTTPRLGVAATAAVFVASQLILGAVFDHFGWLGLAERALDLPRLLGIAVLLFGTWLLVR